jgi:predicted CXXCH cytochrome family protein
MDNSCLNCHRNHNAKGKERLLSSIQEEKVCFVCHNGNVGKNIRSVLGKTSGHRVDFYQGVHDPTENILSAPVHSECVDCHNPHQINNSNAKAPYVSGMLVGVSGMSVTGIPKEIAQYEYEVCLKCHGQDKYRVKTAVRRMFDTTNIRIAINPSNASFHAIAAQGTSNWVPSLEPPYTTSSRLYCTDCHNNDSSTKSGGSGPNGPHGSNYEYILERRYVTLNYAPWWEANYALCFKCHNPVYLFNEKLSGFGAHEKHVKIQNTPCSVCHDPHGSPQYIGLLNFDLNAVHPNGNDELKFVILGNKGYCYLECHGIEHKPREYIRR